MLKVLRPLALALAVAACDHDPTAPPQPQRLVFEGVVPASGQITPIELPATVDTFPPFNCFVSGDGEYWFRVDDWPGVAGPGICYLQHLRGTTFIKMTAPAEWQFRVVVY